MTWFRCVKYGGIRHGPREKRTSYVQCNEWLGHILRKNCLRKHVTDQRWKGWEDAEEDVSSY